MADVVTFKPEPQQPPQDAPKSPEAVVQPNKGSTKVVTADTTQKLEKPAEAPKARPEWLPKEFNTPEEFAQAYQKSVEEKAKATVKTPEEPPKEEPKAAEVVEKAGLKMDDLSREFAETGKLSDESLGSLEKAGVTRAQVDAYIEGQKAQAELINQRMAESVGGKDNLSATLEWARTALTKAEIEAADAVLQSGNEAQAKIVLQGLNARRVAENGSEPRLVAGRAVAASEEPGYESSAQMVADMNSKAYKQDPAFRALVARRLKASKF